MAGSAAGMLVAAAVAGQGAAAAPLEDPEAEIQGEVVVTARLPGPAWWKVSDGDSAVYILGMPEGPLPPGVTWDRSVLERRLKGAKVLIDRPVMTLGLGGAPALLRARSQLRSKRPLEETLPPPLRARFVAARERIGQPAARYADWEPLVAGERLAADSRGGVAWSDPSRDVRQRAKALKVPTRRPSYSALPGVRQAGSLTEPVQQQCLEFSLDDAERNAGRTGTAAARAWARGEVAGALTAPRSFSRCQLLLNGGGEMWLRGNRDQAAMMAETLATPGHAVAVVGLRRLLAKGGVLQQLRARGLKVTGPAEPEG